MNLRTVIFGLVISPFWLSGCTTPQTDFHGNATPGKTDADNPSYTNANETVQPPASPPASRPADPLTRIGTSQSNGGSSSPTGGP